MLSPRNAALSAAFRLLCPAHPLRSFAASKPAVSTSTVPASLDGLRADRVLLALLQACLNAPDKFFERVLHPLFRIPNGLLFSGLWEQVAYASEKARTPELVGASRQTNGLRVRTAVQAISLS
jgi:hypothetical protein